MSEKNVNNLINSLDEVLHFSSEMIKFRLGGEKPEQSRVNEIREHCKVLANGKVFDFDTECDDVTLFKQIQKFASRVD